MPGRLRCARSRLAAILLSAAVFLPSITRAQTLDLDGSSVLQGSNQKALDRFITSLESDLKPRLDALRDAGPLADAPSRGKARVRQLMLALAQAGKGYGEAGSVHVLTARRLAARLAEVDASLDRIDLLGDRGRAAITAFVGLCPTAPGDIPRSVTDLDVMLSRAFERIMPASWPGARTGWQVVGVDAARSKPEAVAPVVEAIAKAPGVSAAAVASVQGFLGRLGPDDLGAAQRELVVLASGAVTGAPRWITPKASAAIASYFDAAALQLSIADARDAARIDLARLALLSDVLTRIDGAKVATRQARSLRTLGVKICEELSPGSSASDDVLGALRRGLMLAEEHDAARWYDDRRVVREVRTAWRVLEGEARRAREELVEMLAGLSTSMPALSDPGVLHGLAGLSDRLDDGRRLCVISEWLAGNPDPGLSGPLVWMPPAGADAPRTREPLTSRERVEREAARRMVRLGQAMMKIEEREQALTTMRELADGLASWMPVPGELELRAAIADPSTRDGAAWATLGGGKLPALRDALNASREAALTTWAGVEDKPARGAPPPPEPAPVPIEDLAALVRLVADVVVVDSMAASSPATGISAWPGFQTSRGSLAALVAPLHAELPRDVALALAGDTELLERSLEGMRQHGSVVGVLAELERGALRAGLSRADVFAEQATPPVALPTLRETLLPRTWLIEARRPIAILCRCLEEYEAATSTGDRERSLAIFKQMAAESDRIAPRLR